jgi:hypothetical protein
LILKDYPNQILQGIDNLLETKGVMAGNVSEQRLVEILKRHSEELLNARSSEEQKAVSLEILPVNGENQFQVFFWGNEFHSVPENFRLPSCSLGQAFCLWHFGNQTLRIRPYKKLASRDFIKKTWKNELCEWRKIMGHVMNFLEDQEPGFRMENLSEEDADKLLESAAQHIYELHDRKRKRQRLDNRNSVLTVLSLASKIKACE